MKTKQTTPRVKQGLIYQYGEGKWIEKNDLFAAEEPLEIRLGWGEIEFRQQKKLVVTMRTPGNDFELCVGFLFNEGILHSSKDILSIRHCLEAGKGEAYGNVVRVELNPDCNLDFDKLQRNFFTTSACGVCGKTGIEAIHTACLPLLKKNAPLVSPSLLANLPLRLREKQAVFEHTGGLHAAALFLPDGDLLLSYEDVGRHNALDKLIGACVMLDQIPLSDHLLFLSGRISFELVQKALMAGIPIVAAVGAPSSLAVELARDFGMTLLGFVRDNKFNVYSGKERLKIN